MSLLILNASVAHTATTNVIINNKVIVYYFCYPNVLFDDAKLTLFAHTGKNFGQNEQKHGISLICIKWMIWFFARFALPLS